MSYTPVPSKLDDAAFGIATDQVSPAGYLVDEVAADSADEGDIGLARMNAKRIQLAELRTQTGDSAMDDTNDAVRVNVVSGGFGGAVTVADGADVAEGATTDAAVTSDTTGTVSGKLRGLVKILASAWDSVNGRLKVDASAVAVPVTDNGGLLSVDDGGGSLTVDGAVTATVSGTVDVGSVTTAIVPGTGATNLGKAEDAGHATGDTGLLALTVRNDSNSASGLAGTDLDYQALQSDNTGSLKVVVTGGATKTDKTSFVEGTGAMTPVGGVFNDTIGADPTEDQAAALRITARRGLHVNLRDSAGVEALVPGTAATHLGKAEDAAHGSGDTGVMLLGVRNDTRGTLSGTDGDYTPPQFNSGGDLRVDGSAVTQPVSGTVAISGAADTQLRDGSTVSLVYDQTVRATLQELLLEVQQLSERMFDETR